MFKLLRREAIPETGSIVLNRWFANVCDEILHNCGIDRFAGTNSKRNDAFKELNTGSFFGMPIGCLMAPQGIQIDLVGKVGRTLCQGNWLFRVVRVQPGRQFDPELAWCSRGLNRSANLWKQFN